ncbi:MAG: hypothetical protein D4R57_00550 [Verrucomicrobiales bacterium]|nr:MAG: hypothetical protein D4R57_00550 [Verrucomicrobiales bacterium]
MKGGNERRRLMTWVLAKVKTAELRRLKSQDLSIVRMVEQLRQEKLTLEFELERTRKSLDGLRFGHERWREEAVKQMRVREVLLNFINQEMKMYAADPRIAKLIRMIDKAEGETNHVQTH